jgi:hypothetical protein
MTMFEAGRNGIPARFSYKEAIVYVEERVGMPEPRQAKSVTDKLKGQNDHLAQP